ncbi:MAG: hypothetical protein WAV25_00495 [Minisyncoccia bacterium]
MSRDSNEREPDSDIVDPNDSRLESDVPGPGASYANDEAGQTNDHDEGGGDGDDD